MKINLQITKMMIKMNKQRYFDASFRYSRASWGVLGCPGEIRLTLFQYFYELRGGLTLVPSSHKR